MRHQERLEIIANAFVSELAPLAEQDRSNAAAEAIMRVRIKNTIESMNALFMERYQQSVSNKNFFQVVGASAKFIRFVNKQKKELPQIVNDAAVLAMDYATRASLDDLRRAGLAQISLEGAVRSVVDDLMLEAGF